MQVNIKQLIDMAQELALNGSDVQHMTAQLREGILKKSPR